LRLSNIIDEKTILLDIKAKGKAEAIREMVNYLKRIS